MTLLFSRVLVVLVALFAGTALRPVFAIDMEGDFIQGGMVKGKGEPGIRLELNGEPVYVSADGRFVFGFGRDAPSLATLTIIHPDGKREVRELSIGEQIYDIERIEGLPPEKVTIPEEELQRRAEERVMVTEARSILSERFDWERGFSLPAEGRISGVYGSQRILNGEPRYPHYGLDVAGPVNTPVHAPAGGVVVLAENDFLLEGGLIIIDHGFKVFSTLMHLASVGVEVGQRVEKGERIGGIGATGRATGPHVDWRVNWKDVRLDPALLVGNLEQTEGQGE